MLMLNRKGKKKRNWAMCVIDFFLNAILVGISQNTILSFVLSSHNTGECINRSVVLLFILFFRFTVGK